MVSQAHTLWLTFLFACATVIPISGLAQPSVAEESAVLQSVLDYPQLQAFFHPKLPGRVPVRVFVRDGSLGIHAQKFGAPVHVLTKDSHLAPTVIRLTKFNIGKDTAEVALNYPVEGLHGRFTLRYDGNRWRIIRASVRER